MGRPVVDRPHGIGEYLSQDTTCGSLCVGATMEWARSKTIGGVTEVTLFTPIRQGLVTDEGQTYEQRLALALESVQRRVLDRIPTPINGMPTIHFARWLILRPGQYLQYSVIDPDPTKNPTLHSWLFFESNFDGQLKDYLREFAVFLEIG